MSRPLCALLAIAVCGSLALGCLVFADDDVNNTAGSDLLKTEAHKAVVAEMKRILERIKIVRQGTIPDVAELVPQPVLNWDDIERGHYYGTTWVWGEKGRPAAIIEMYTTQLEKTINRWPGNVVHLILEAVERDRETFWQFGCVRLGHAEIQVKFDEIEVWKRETFSELSPKSPYYHLLPSN